MQGHVAPIDAPGQTANDQSELRLIEKWGQLLNHQRTLELFGNRDEFDALAKADLATQQLHSIGFEVAAMRARSIYALAAKAMFVMEHCEDCKDDIAHVLARSLSSDILALAQEG
jgi:hypothetical protein